VYAPTNVLHVPLPYWAMIAAAVNTASALVSYRLARVHMMSRRHVKTTNQLHRQQGPCQSPALQATRHASRKRSVSRRRTRSGSVADQRPYRLTRQPPPIADRQCEIEFLDASVEAYAFTFG
jgi:hypothetical protein